MLQYKQALIPLKRQITELEYIVARSDIKSWAAVQEIVRAGLASKAFNIGDQLLANYNGSPVAWDVIGIDHDVPTDSQYTHSLTIQAHNCLSNVQFDAPEALYYAEAELAPGEYTFNDGTTDYTFTLGSAIPAGGQAVLTWAGTPTAIPTEIKTYPTKLSTTAIETIAVTAGATGTALTPINDLGRARYGSNNYKDSAIRQWLNSSEASFTFAAQTNYDRPPTDAPFTGAGFLNLLDADLVAVLGNVNKVTAKNTITDGGGSEASSEKIFLLSRSEVYTGLENSINEGLPYAYYSALNSVPVATALAGRIKYLSGSPRGWWLRSPASVLSYNPRVIYTAGELISYYAYYGEGCAPACCII